MGQPVADLETLETLPEVYALRPWYHDFSRLGLRTTFDPPRPGAGALLKAFLRGVASRLSPSRIEKGERLLSRAALGLGPPSHLVNQRHKEAVLLPLVECCLHDLGPEPSCLELFCADGYYALNVAARAPEAPVLGVDLDAKEIERAQTAARILGHRHARFQAADVWRFLESRRGSYDLILCAGGLYHLTDPRRLLAELRPVAGRYLVLQSVVSLDHEADDYFETPAPGWRHGCRFSHARLERWLTELGWRIVAQERNELPGNRRPRDRGSSYFLCQTSGA